MRASVVVVISGVLVSSSMGASARPAVRAPKVSTAWNSSAAHESEAPHPTRGMRPSQVGAALRMVRDLKAPREGTGDTSRGSWLRLNGIGNRISAAFLGTAKGKEARESIGHFIADVESSALSVEASRSVRSKTAPKASITDLTPESTPEFAVLRFEKALTLHHFRRTPSQVTEQFVKASGTVDGHAIADRHVFVQHWSPVRESGPQEGALVENAPASRKIFVFSPGYRQSGTAFYPEVDAFTRAGHDAFVMDHQWTGYTNGKNGFLDRGYGVARDVAAVTAHVNEWAKKKYGSQDYEIILVGNSMGAGPGAVGAVGLNEAGKIHLAGAQMPKDVPLILHSPYLGVTDNETTRRDRAIGRIPVVKNLPIPIYDNQKSAQAADLYTLQDQRQRASTYDRAQPDLDKIIGNKISSRVWVVQSANDSLANPEIVRRFVKTTGARARLESIPGDVHALEGNPEIIRRVLTKGIPWVSEPDAPAR